VQGTALAQKTPPEVRLYRRIQVARYLISHGKARFEEMEFAGDRLKDFGVDRQTLERLIKTGEPFVTSGCPGCNRPYYNERPAGTIYNYARKLTRSEVSRAESELALGEENTER
jgi:biotin synthase-related radical SAM superfamily protein